MLLVINGLSLSTFGFLQSTCCGASTQFAAPSVAVTRLSLSSMFALLEALVLARAAAISLEGVPNTDVDDGKSCRAISPMP